MVNLYQKPKVVEFSQPYSGGSGDRIKVNYSEKQADIKIETTDFILVDKSDIGWLIEVLQDVKRLHLETIKTEKSNG